MAETSQATFIPASSFPFSSIQTSPSRYLSSKLRLTSRCILPGNLARDVKALKTGVVVVARLVAGELLVAELEVGKFFGFVTKVRCG